MYLYRFSKFFVLLALIIMLAACGNTGNANVDNTGTAATPSPEETATPIAVEESATKTITTLRGDLEIPTNPQRIVTDGYLPELLVLGVKPIGSTRWDLENKVIGDQIDGIANTGERSLETVLELEPDLIVTWVSDETIIQQYEKIAPTLSIPYGTNKSIHETIRYLGDVLNKQSEATQWLAGFDETVASARAELADVIQPEDTFALMGVFVVDKGFYIYGDGGYRGGEAIYTHLQLKAPVKQQAEMIGKEAYRQISYEVVPDYAGDYIFLDQGDMIAEVWGENQGVWSSLDAVKNDRVFKLDPELFWGNDPISLQLQVQEIVKMLKARQ